MSKIYLIRHAQASYLSADYDNLSEKGTLQSECLGDFFVKNNIHFDQVFIGKLKRHRQTFEGFEKAFLNKGIELPKPIYLQELNEHHVPQALKLAYEDFVSKNDSAKILYHAFLENPKLKRKNSIKIFGLFMKEYASGRYIFKHESIQPWSEFQIQTKKAVATILEKTKKGETIGIFTSGGTKGSIIGKCLGVSDEKIAELNLAIKNTSFSQLLYTENKLNLFSFNEVSHLSKDLFTFV